MAGFDHCRLSQRDTVEGDERNEQIGSYSRDLTALAKKLGAAVIALAQMNRGLWSDPTGASAADLRDSDQIERD